MDFIFDVSGLTSEDDEFTDTNNIPILKLLETLFFKKFVQSQLSHYLTLNLIPKYWFPKIIS